MSRSKPRQTRPRAHRDVPQRMFWHAVCFTPRPKKLVGAGAGTEKRVYRGRQVKRRCLVRKFLASRKWPDSSIEKRHSSPKDMAATDQERGKRNENEESTGHDFARRAEDSRPNPQLACSFLMFQFATAVRFCYIEPKPVECWSLSTRQKFFC